MVRRFEVYDNKFLTKPCDPTDAVKKADELLRPRFLIKQRLTGWKAVLSMFQYIPIIWDIFWNAEKYLIDENDAVNEAQERLRSKNLC